MNYQTKQNKNTKKKKERKSNIFSDLKKNTKKIKIKHFLIQKSGKN